MARNKTKGYFILYFLLGKRNGSVVILGNSRNLSGLKSEFKTKGWKDEEFIVEEVLDEVGQIST